MSHSTLERKKGQNDESTRRVSSTNPLDKPAGVIAVLGAGNYSASIETVKALFWENKAVIHKPHRLSQGTDGVWQKVFALLVELGALAFCDADDGRALTQLRGLTAIYFIGSTSSAKAIMASTCTRPPRAIGVKRVTISALETSPPVDHVEPLGCASQRAGESRHWLTGCRSWAQSGPNDFRM